MMGGMGMQPTEAEQRSHFAMMLVSRVSEMFGMLSQVLSMLFGSGVQFAQAYMGFTHQYKQINDQAPGPQTQGHVFSDDGEMVIDPENQQQYNNRRRGGVPHDEGWSNHWLTTLLRRGVLLVCMYLVAKRLLRVTGVLPSPTATTTAAALDPEALGNVAGNGVAAVAAGGSAALAAASNSQHHHQFQQQQPQQMHYSVTPAAVPPQLDQQFASNAVPSQQMAPRQGEGAAATNNWAL